MAVKQTSLALNTDTFSTIILSYCDSGISLKSMQAISVSNLPQFSIETPLSFIDPTQSTVNSPTLSEYVETKTLAPHQLSESYSPYILIFLVNKPTGVLMSACPCFVETLCKSP